MTLPQQPRVVITGAGGGLGRALCLALASRGANILVSDVDMKNADETAQLVVAHGGKARTLRCDVSKADEVEAPASFADRELGGTDLLINNAGVAVSGLVGDISLANWQWITNINLWGVVHGCHSFVPRFKQRRSGHILNVASAAGLISSPEMAPYNVTKAGVVALSETLCSELSEFGVGITVLCPTFFQTGILSNARSESVTPMVNVAQKMMRASKVQAPEVAARALRACDKNELYCVPMTDGQVSWRTKGLAPELFYKHIMPNALKMLTRRDKRD